MTRALMQEGERLWSGAIATASFAEAVNAANRKIWAFEDAGQLVPEHLLNGRHNLIANHSEGLKP